jgi:hypothetical protein
MQAAATRTLGPQPIQTLLDELFVIDDFEVECHIEDAHQLWRWARERWELYGCQQDYNEMVALCIARSQAGQFRFARFPRRAVL